MRLPLALSFFTPITWNWDVNFVAAEPKCIQQADFDGGTYTILASGDYMLCSDISFAPSKPDLSTATDVDIATAFDHAHVAALLVSAPNVTLDLNGYTIEQDPSHALMQRQSFAIIALASDLSTNFRVKGPGTIGLSSQYGVHGVNNKEVTIENVVFRDFEVAAVVMESVEGLTIKRNSVVKNRRDVPVLSSFSAATRILPFVKELKDRQEDYSMALGGSQTSATEVYNSLVTSIVNVYRDVMGTGFIDDEAHPEEFYLFHNVHHVADKNCYAFFVHGDGESSIAENVVIEHNDIHQIQCFSNEVLTSVVDRVVQIDASGAAVQLVNTFANKYIAMDPDMHYAGNVVSDAQIMVAKAIQEGVLSSPNHQNTISAEMIDWAEDSTKVFDPNFRCNGSGMDRFVIRIEDTAGFAVMGNTIDNASVITGASFQTAKEVNLFLGEPAVWECSSFNLGKNVLDGNEQPVSLSGISIGITGSDPSSNIEGAYSSVIKGNSIYNLSSQHARLIVGIDVQKIPGVLLAENVVDLAHGTGGDPKDPYVSCRLWQCENVINENNIFIQEPLYDSISSLFVFGSSLLGRRLRGSMLL